MAAGDLTPGRRREDTPSGDLPPDVQPGDYWKVLSGDGSRPLSVTEPSNLTGCVWMFSAPNGCGIGTLTLHTVREHEDGTCTIAANDGSSNSVLIRGGEDGRSWHGYMDRGVWRAVE